MRKPAALEGRLAVRRGSRDQHDVLTDRDPPVPVDHGQAEERPARRGFGRDPLDLGLRHPRIVLELECGEPPTLVAADAGESDDRTGIAAWRRSASTSAAMSKSSL